MKLDPAIYLPEQIIFPGNFNNVSEVDHYPTITYVTSVTYVTSDPHLHTRHVYVIHSYWCSVWIT